MYGAQKPSDIVDAKPDGFKIDSAELSRYLLINYTATFDRIVHIQESTWIYHFNCLGL